MTTTRPESALRRYLWSTRWVGRFECVSTLYWKFLWVNRLGWREERVIAAKPYLPNDGVHSVDSFGELACLFDEGPIRICERCLSSGYRSIFFNLKVTVRCPIHGEPLKDSCQCGAELPSYREATTRTDHPFYCSSCGKAFVEPFTPERFMRADADIHPFEDRFAPFVDWLERLRKCGYDIESQRSVIQIAGSRGARIDREMLSGLMQAICPFEGMANLLHQPAMKLSSREFAESPRRTYPTFFGWRNDPVYDLVPVDRYVQERYLKGLDLKCWEYRRASYRSGLFGYRWLKRRGTHPLVHAYWVWRYDICGLRHYGNGSQTLMPCADCRPVIFSARAEEGTEIYRARLVSLFLEAVWCTLRVMTRPRALHGLAAENFLRDIERRRYAGVVPTIPVVGWTPAKVGRRLVFSVDESIVDQARALARQSELNFTARLSVRAGDSSPHRQRSNRPTTSAKRTRRSKQHL